MTYLRRSLKYFIQITVLFVVIMLVLIYSGMASKDVASIFRHGWNSVVWILILFAVMSLFYPRFGYQKRKIALTGDPAEARGGIIEAMRRRGYVLDREEDGALKFHLSAPLNRFARLWEDTITLTPVLGGWEAEGLARDLVRVVSSIEQKFRANGTD